MLRPYTVGAIRAVPRRQLALPPLALRLGVQSGQVAAVVLEDVEPTLSLGQTVVVDLVGSELVVDPAHHALRRHAWYVAGSGPVREAVQGVERRVLRGQGRLLSPDPDRQQPRRQQRPNDQRFHAVILTHRPLEKLRS